MRVGQVPGQSINLSIYLSIYLSALEPTAGDGRILIVRKNTAFGQPNHLATQNPRKGECKTSVHRTIFHSR